MSENIIDMLKFNSHGLIPAIIQDFENNEVLMMAYMNRESVSLTLSTGVTHFYSRSRGKLWKKGESSGHIQKVKEVYYDCDNDTLLFKVEQVVAACHTGARSCFFNKIEGENIKFSGKKVFDPEKVYDKNSLKKA